YRKRGFISAWFLGAAHRLDRAETSSPPRTSVGRLPLGGSFRQPALVCVCCADRDRNPPVDELCSFDGDGLAKCQVHPRRSSAGCVYPGDAPLGIERDDRALARPSPAGFCLGSIQETP